VEKTTGMNLQDYCNKFIFHPLQISPSYWFTQHVRDNIVHLSYRESDGHLSRWDNQYALMEQDLSKSLFSSFSLCIQYSTRAFPTGKLSLGGAGFYSTTKDFLAILRHLLLAKDGRAPNAILKSESVDIMFSSSIPDTATTHVESFLDYPNEMKLQFGYGLCVTLTDWPGRRKKGSGFWYGWAGIYFFVDPETGIAAVYATQVLPTRDAEVVALFQRLEETLYKAVG
jgi:methyl acetate hydrolase